MTGVQTCALPICIWFGAEVADNNSYQQGYYHSDRVVDTLSDFSQDKGGAESSWKACKCLPACFTRLHPPSYKS